jgi:hypothetical protein
MKEFLVGLLVVLIPVIVMYLIGRIHYFLSGGSVYDFSDHAECSAIGFLYFLGIAALIVIFTLLESLGSYILG